MRKRVQIALAVLLVAVAGVTLWQVVREPEPAYQGRPVSYWISRWGDIYAPWNADYPDYDRGPIGWLPAADSNAIPFLVKALKRRDGLLGRAYPRMWLGLPPWIRARLPRPILAGLVRVNAAFALGQMGAAGRPAVPALLQALRENKSRRETALLCLALGKIGKQEQAVKATLRATLSDKRPGVRSATADALAVMGGSAKDAVPALVRCLDDQDRDTRHSISNALKAIDPEAAAKAGVK
ncbi:MAG TPA: HEAT repeat domain-containing protein [Candidatus Acidoferrum sp.]|jgi:hypothetical protein|nr:HEAT repeat domain-containing protein [Candidatus Acidoferrum sp.]